jgi:hypothetical protein
MILPVNCPEIFDELSFKPYPWGNLMSGEIEQNLVYLVEETMRTLHGKGVPLEDLAPLVKLHDAVSALNQTQGADAMPPAPSGEADIPPAQSGHFIREARLGEIKASEVLLARASAIIDVMVQGGQTPEQAAQVITRQLMAVEIEVPENGGDMRAWKRLLSFRNTLIHYIQEGPVRDAYSAFKEQLSGIAPDQRLRRAVGEQLWDRRELVEETM